MNNNYDGEMETIGRTISNLTLFRLYFIHNSVVLLSVMYCHLVYSNPYLHPDSPDLVGAREGCYV